MTVQKNLFKAKSLRNKQTTNQLNKQTKKKASCMLSVSPAARHKTPPKSLCYMCHLNVKHFSYDLQPAEASVHDGAFRGEDATTSFIHQPTPTQLLLLTASNCRRGPVKQWENMLILKLIWASECTLLIWFQQLDYSSSKQCKQHTVKLLLDLNKTKTI